MGIAGLLGSTRETVQEMGKALSPLAPSTTFSHYWGRHPSGVHLAGTHACTRRGRDGHLRSIVFDGRLTNGRELNTLIGVPSGGGARTAAELLLDCYLNYGEDCLRYARGSFAFAIADDSTQRLFIARDPLGNQPLFYAWSQQDGYFAFASEIKALLRYNRVPASLDTTTLVDSLVLDYRGLGHRTFFAGICAFPPGSFCTLQPPAQERSPLHYEAIAYAQPFSPTPTEMPLDFARNSILDLFQVGICENLNADSPLAIALAGLDSALFAALFHERFSSKYRFSTWTIASSPDHPDALHAQILSEKLATDHTLVPLTSEQYLQAIPRYMLVTEQLTQLDGLPLFLLCQALSHEARTLVTGESADILFGGSKDYLDPPQQVASYQQRIRWLQEHRLSPSPSLLERVDALASAPTAESYLERLLTLKMQGSFFRTSIELVEKCARAAGLTSYNPYAEEGLVRFALRLPWHLKVNENLGIRKYALKRIAVDTYGSLLLDLALRRKTGFPAAGAEGFAEFRALCATLPKTYQHKHEWGWCFSTAHHLLLFDLFQELFFRRRGVLDPSFDLKDFIRSRGHS